MRHLKLAAVLTAILLVSFFAFTRVITAFSVGHLTVKRNSEAGFVAEVPFELSKGEHGKRVEVRLGGPGHYALLGKSRPKELEQMRVHVDRRRSKAYIQSLTPLRAPLDLIVKVTVDSGTILKRFPIAVKSALNLKPTGAQPTVDKTRRVAKPSQNVRKRPNVIRGVYGPVRPGETLWQIAKKLECEELPLECVVVTLWRDNLEEFAFGNMHALRPDSYLDCSNLDADAAGIFLNEARQIIDDQWGEWRKVKFVRAASRKSTPPLVKRAIVTRAEESSAAARGKMAEVTAKVPEFPAAESARYHLKVAAVERRQPAGVVSAASEQRRVLVRKLDVGPLAQLQMGMSRAGEMKGEETVEKPIVASEAVGVARQGAEAMLAPDVAKLKEEIASTKELLVGRISGLEGEFADRFFRSDRINQVFYAVFVIENLILLVILLLSMRKRRARERMGRESQPVRSKVYLRNALHQRYL